MAEQQNSANHISEIKKEEFSHSFAFFHKFCPSGILEKKDFFEFYKNSLLPEEEFDHIWQLSDNDKDNQLNVAEFILAVHLIKARLLGISLPKDSVPKQLLLKLAPFKLPPATDEHIAKCKVAFLDNKQHLDSEIRMLGKGARLLLLRSGLSHSTLFHIWKLSDADEDDCLAFSEFVVAIHLVNLAIKGYMLPVSLDHKVILRSKKIKTPDTSSSSPKPKIAHIPWINSSTFSGTPSSPLLDKFVLPSTPLSPAPDLPTPEHPFMSFSTFFKSTHPATSVNSDKILASLSSSEIFQSKNSSKPYYNLLVGSSGPIDETQAPMESLPPPLPPRLHVDRRKSEDIQAKDDQNDNECLEMVEEPAWVYPKEDTPPIKHRFTSLKEANSSPTPSPAKLKDTDNSLEFMKSLENLTSIGTYTQDVMGNVSSPVPSPEPATHPEEKMAERNDSYMAEELDNLVAALSLMESSLVNLEENVAVEPEDPVASRSSLKKKTTKEITQDESFHSLEEEIHVAIRDTSPVPEVEEEASAIIKKLTKPASKPKPVTPASKEYADLISSLQSVGEEKTQKDEEPEEDGEGLIASLQSFGNGSEVQGSYDLLTEVSTIREAPVATATQQTKVPPKPKSGPKFKSGTPNGTDSIKASNAKSTKGLDIDSYLQEELETFNQVLGNISK